ncbi:hypothetical protein [Chlorobium sp. N1]|uniref:hypothetical protein n=1 Tax=Chlorobium sp. N1 TaxID=2491138 RepID=UPI00103DF29D|nr:hypothetical protein [Chlorobium sp. N1]TCD47006.1 hypothetical protein E0L29_10240 [Chlorobium sp. N1]
MNEERITGGAPSREALEREHAATMRRLDLLRKEFADYVRIQSEAAVPPDVADSVAMIEKTFKRLMQHAEQSARRRYAARLGER